jgi:predicted transcriptional regulator
LTVHEEARNVDTLMPFNTVLTTDLVERLKREARLRHCSMAYLVRQAVRDYLKGMTSDELDKTR